MVYHVYANQSNAGDWLSALGIQSLLAPLPVTEHFCDEPFVPDTLAALAQAGPDDFIIIGGGGLFMDYFVPFWEGFRPMASRVPFCLWGVGYCDMKQALSRPPLNLLAEIIQHSRLCVVRDELTRFHLRGCGLRPPVPCPSVIAIGSANGQQPGLLHVDHYDSVGPEIYERMVGMAEAYARGTGRTYRQTNNRITAGNRAALSGVLARYQASDLVLTSRLHGCIIAVAMGLHVLAVSGDHKVESFMRAAELEEWVCDRDEIDTLPERLAALPTQSIRSAFVEEARRQNREVAAEVLNLIGSPQAIGTIR